MKLPPGCWCFAREAGKAPTSWVDSYAETSLDTGCFEKHLVSEFWGE
ncbi:hypothetical protein [Leptolyngbya sp. FACHB-16]|nr:hypothetical protein [Leptolyngbya sp. FACHB-16]MBD1910304.1 hypothetical protein [Leptolyngbya sp. FACHB-8]MBD2155784.1 hypothetical protein [Leptolyngbya sp. FACHB-16]